MITEWNRRPNCPTHLRFKSTIKGILLEWSMKQQNSPVTEYIVGCGQAYDGKEIHRTGSDKTMFEFGDLCR